PCPRPASHHDDPSGTAHAGPHPGRPRPAGAALPRHQRAGVLAAPGAPVRRRFWFGFAAILLPLLAVLALVSSLTNAAAAGCMLTVSSLTVDATGNAT